MGLPTPACSPDRVCDDPSAEISVAVQANDASRILDAVGHQAAYVFGNSGRAITALELVIRHPEQVLAPVAHEPPLVNLLPDASALFGEVDAIMATYKSEGAAAAMWQFAMFAGMVPRGTAGPGPAMARAQDASPSPNLFLGNMLVPITRYVADRATLTTTAIRISVGVGNASAEQVANRSALALAAL